MYRAGLIAVAALLAASPVRAQPPADQAAPDQAAPDQAAPDQAAPDQAAPDQAAPDQAAPDQAAPDQAAPDQAASDAGAQPADETARKPRRADQELSGSLGLDVGGRVSPGGVHVAGAYLYQLSDQDWFDGGLSFTFGSGQAACFRDREDDYLCDHGTLDGFGAEVFGGVRRYFPGEGTFTPYARAALGLRLVSFGGDDVHGLAIPLQLGGGVRARVADRISVSGGAELRVGPAFFNSGLETQPHLGLTVHGGVEFAL